MEQHGIWIRVAGNAMNIRTGASHHWRVFLGRALPERPVRVWQLLGVADGQNVVPGTDPTAGNACKLNAWIDYFGDIVIDDGIATITLRPVR